MTRVLAGQIGRQHAPLGAVHQRRRLEENGARPLPFELGLEARAARLLHQPGDDLLAPQVHHLGGPQHDGGALGRQPALPAALRLGGVRVGDVEIVAIGLRDFEQQPAVVRVDVAQARFAPARAPDPADRQQVESGIGVRYEPSVRKAFHG
jgi:hypothetical protein